MNAVWGKRFESGMYGGKFLPYHRGHLYCLEVASRMCRHVWQLLMVNGADEERILLQMAPEEREKYTPEKRFARMKSAGDRLGNVDTVLVDLRECRTQDGAEDWDAETPLVLTICGRMDAVFSSEPSYGQYFSRAYPWAKHILVDPPRNVYPVSGTAIRDGSEEAKRWII